MDQNILISVVTPVYNGEKFLRDNINSWLSQTYPYFEIVFVDDGSTDRSIEVIKSFAAKDHRIKLVRVRHGGISEATKKGLEVASSKYIVLMDQDDVATPKRLELTAWAFHHGAELIMGDYEIVDEDLHSNDKIITFPLFITKENLLLEHLKRMHFLGSSMAFIYKGDFEFNLKSYGATDYDIVLKMLLNNYCFRYIPETLIKYRVHNNNTSANYAKQKNYIKNVFSQFNHFDLYNNLICKGFNEFDSSLALGICYLFQNEYKIASNYLEKSFTKRKYANERTLEEVLFYNGVLMYLEQKYNSSLSFFSQLLEKNYCNPAILNNIGVIEAIMGNKKESVIMFEKAININCEYQDVKRNIKSNGKNNNFHFTMRLLRETLTHTHFIK